MKRIILCSLALALPTALAAAGQPAPAARPNLAVVADFPGGSAEVASIDQAARLIRLRPADHPGRGWRCWWYFKVTGLVPGETLTFEMTADGFGLPDCAAAGTDDRTWRQTEAGSRAKGSVTYRHKAEAAEMYFAWGPPYLPRDAEDFIRRAEKTCPQARGFELCRTLEDRPVPALRLTPPRAPPGAPAAPSDAAPASPPAQPAAPSGVPSAAAPAQSAARSAPPPAIWVQARQHAWESGGSWVGQGLAEWLISDDPRAAALRARAEVIFIPIMDVDNVVRGAGGKNESPQDHNRDWSDHPHWRSVQAAQRLIRDLAAEGRLALFLDLHNPGPNERDMYFYCGPRDMMAAPQVADLEAFMKAAVAEMKGPPVFKGALRETGPKYDPKNWQRMSKNWVNANSPKTVALTLETGWNHPAGTADGYREVGRQLGLTVEQYMRSR
ncbi:MAG: zinc carboxypeptidase [Planctomycetes bacterium]|nr:zinc carboxypeptidase [Planctomycetota bacterium]